MAALDQRLVRRTRSVRPLLALDTALGLVTIGHDVQGSVGTAGGWSSAMR